MRSCPSIDSPIRTPVVYQGQALVGGGARSDRAPLHRWLLYSLPCLIFSTLPARAQPLEPLVAPLPETAATTSTAPDAILDTIKAVAEIPYRTGDVISEENTTSHSRIERRELEQSTHSLAGVLARETGVQYRQSGGFGSYSSVSIRAATGAQTDVYLDGVLLNNGGSPAVDLSTLEMLNLESIDIYRGSTPLQLGHGSIGGAVNLNSLQSVSEPTTRIRLGIGKLGRRELQLSHQTIHGAWDMVAALSHRQSNNDFLIDNDHVTPLNPDDVFREKRNNADARRTTALFRTGYQHDRDTRTDVTVQVSARDLGVPEFNNNPDNVASYDTDTTQVQLSQILDGLGNWNSRHNLYWHGNSAQYQDLFSQVGLGAQDTDSDSNTLGAKTYWEYLADSGTLGLSLDVRRERYDSTDANDAAAAFNADRDRTQASVHYVWYDRSEAWSVTPAIRWQHSELHGEHPESSGDVPANRSSTDTGLQIGLAYRPPGKLSYTANAGSYYREPSFGELYGSSGLVNGNPDLLPEKGLNVDVGLHYQSRGTELSATVFGSDRDELIVTAYNSRGIGGPLNTGAARVIGLELAAGIALTPQLDLSSNLTWQSTRNLDEAVSFHDRLLPGEAQLAWSSRLQYQYLQTSLWYELDVLRKRFYDQGNLLPAADSELHSVGIDWKSPKWQTTLGINNLGNDNIEDFNGFPKPGRTWSLTVTRTLTHSAN